MSKKTQIYIQGYSGSFHDEAANQYFNEEYTAVPCDSFDQLGRQLSNGSRQDCAVMAIENSIAGSILPNYRILREHGFAVIGEVYLRIIMNLMALPGQTIESLTEVHSHPMALKQTLGYLSKYPHIRLVESEDTALSAKRIREQGLTGIGCVASARAAEIYDLPIYATGIEDNKINYTRFFILKKIREKQAVGNKASIWLRLEHRHGSLLEVMSLIDSCGINMSKLQSFPVLGAFAEYFFHLDLEFDDISQYQALKAELPRVCMAFDELGVYQRADISAALRAEEIAVML